MANFQVTLEYYEVEQIITDTVRKKFNLDPKLDLTIAWNDAKDVGLLIESGSAPLSKGSWLDD